MSSRDSIAFRVERLLAVALLGLTSALVNDALAGAAPQEPSVILDTTAVAPTGKTVSVAAGGDLQGALNSAQPGDVVEIAAGATFTGNFVLPAKSGADSTHWVLVRSSAYASLPAAGSRVAPSNASTMAKIQTSNTAPALAFANGAKFYRLQGIEITTTWSVRTATQYGLVTLGMGSDGSTNATTPSDLPTDVVFDRCYVHGTPTGNVRRGILINSARTAVIDSYISDIHEVGADTQAVGAWNGPGPFAIINNYLEAAGENVMFGGADPSITNLVASDIEIRNNLFSKPLSWKSGDPSYAGIQWSVKNLFELKNAQRLLIDGNVFERIWPAAQVGFAVVFTPRNQNNTAPWSTVQDVTFTNNIVRYAANGINMLGQDSPYISQRQTRVRIANNLFHHVDNILFQVLGGVNNVTIQHNTGLHGGNILSLDGTPADQGFVFTDNLVPHNAYGVFGSNVGVGNPALSTYAPGVVFTNNAIAGPWPTSGGATTSMYSNYPGNFFPASLDAVGFVDRAHDNYRLSSGSPFKGKATDGTDLGVDFDALDAAQSGTNAPSPPAPSPTPSPTASPTPSPTPSATVPPTPAPTPSPAPVTDTTAPTTSIVNPLESATVTGTQPISVTASDNVGVADGAIMIDGSIVASFSGQSATYNWNTTQSAVGSHKLQSKVQDAAGNIGMSAPVDVTVSNGDTTPPSVTITYPSSGIRLARGVQTSIKASATDSGGITLMTTTVNGSVICEQKTASSTASSSCPWIVAGNGKVRIQVRALDSGGNATVASVTVFPR
jgi:hypothetical protein